MIVESEITNFQIVMAHAADSPILDSDGNLIGIVGISGDIDK